MRWSLLMIMSFDRLFVNVPHIYTYMYIIIHKDHVMLMYIYTSKQFQF